jgi:hypothetical protein
MKLRAPPALKRHGRKTGRGHLARLDKQLPIHNLEVVFE